MKCSAIFLPIHLTLLALPLFDFRQGLFTTYNLAAPSFLILPKTAELHIRPPTLPRYRGSSVYCLLSYVVDPILPPLRSVFFFGPGTLDVSQATCGDFSYVSLLGGDIFRLYTHIRDWMLFTMTGA